MAANLPKWGSTRKPSLRDPHLRVTDGGFRSDGMVVSWPAHDTARLTEAFRRAVLRLIVRGERFDEDQAARMLAWPHAGYPAVRIPEDDRAFARRLARYGARCASTPKFPELMNSQSPARAVLLCYE